MNILYITQNYPPDIIGGSTRAEDFVRNLSEMCDVTVLTTHPTLPFGRHKKRYSLLSKVRESDHIEVIRLLTFQPHREKPPFFQWVFYYVVYAFFALGYTLICSSKYDIIITTSPPIFTTISGYLSKKIWKTPWIVDIRDLWVDQTVNLGIVSKKSFGYKISKKIENKSVLKSDAIFCMTETIISNIVLQYDIKKEKCIIVPHSIETSLFLPNDKKTKKIVYTGKIRFGCGIESFVLAMKYLEDQNIVMEIYGDGELKNDILRLIHQNNLDDKVYLNDVIARRLIPKVISESIIGIVPMEQNIGVDYAVPTKLLEFMSCGIPVVASNVGGEVNNIVGKSNCGLLVDNDPKEIANVFERLIQNPSERNRMGENGRNFILDYCDKNEIIMNINKVIKKIQGI